MQQESEHTTDKITQVTFMAKVTEYQQIENEHW
jgi:hypothetical protein